MVEIENRSCPPVAQQHARLNCFPHRALTDAGEGEDDEEGAGHGNRRLGERGEDAPGRLEPAKVAQHAAAADEEEQPEWQADGGEADEGEADDDEVEEGPGVLDEGPEPVGVEVDGELCGEEGDECDVYLAEAVVDRGRATMMRCFCDGSHLRLVDVEREVLWRHRSGCAMEEVGVKQMEMT